MSVKSSAVVFRVLRHLAAETQPVSAGEVARTLRVPVTNAVRALATLEAAGYAERHHGSAGFVIGKSARTLAFAFMTQFPVHRLAMPYLQQLTLETGLTSSLFVRLGWYAVRIGQILGPNVVIHQAGLGEAVPLTLGAPALAILAALPDAAHDSARTRAATGPETAAAPETGRDAHEQVRTQGVAVAPSRQAPDLFDVAAALLDRQDRVVGAIAVEGASADMLQSLRDPNGAARRVMRDLAAKIRGERAMEVSHYDHIDADQIVF